MQDSGGLVRARGALRRGRVEGAGRVATVQASSQGEVERRKEREAEKARQSAARDSVRAWAQELSDLRQRPCFVYVGTILPIMTKPLVRDVAELASGGPIDLLLSSSGGLVKEAWWWSRRLQEASDEFTIFVADRAKSAATLMALGAHQIVLGPDAELGPLDGQMRHPTSERWPGLTSDLSLLQGLETLCASLGDSGARLLCGSAPGAEDPSPTDIELEVTRHVMRVLSRVSPVRVGETRRSIDYIFRLSRELLARAQPGMDAAHREEIIRKLVWDYPDHGYPIDRPEAERLGLPVREPTAEECTILTGLLDPLDEIEGHDFGFINPDSDQCVSDRLQLLFAKAAGEPPPEVEEECPPEALVAADDDEVRDFGDEDCPPWAMESEA